MSKKNKDSVLLVNVGIPGLWEPSKKEMKKFRKTWEKSLKKLGMKVMVAPAGVSLNLIKV